MTGSAPRIVLDTNAWLDLLLFEDPRLAVLGAALHDGDVAAVVNAACLAEWQRVLQYPRLQLDLDRRLLLSQAFDTLTWTSRRTPAAAAAPPPACARGRGNLALWLLAQAVEVELHLIFAVLVLEKFHLLLALQIADLLLLARLVLLPLNLLDL